MQTRNSWSLELILVYTGSGKGKTSACVGQALRACGAGLKVVFGQFIKRDNVAGEQRVLARLESISFLSCGLGFLNHGDLAAHRKKALELLEWARPQRADMFIFDEALNALKHGLIVREELNPWLNAEGNPEFHLVLSGREMPGWLEHIADMVTEMKDIKHQCRRGVQALPGLEY